MKNTITIQEQHYKELKNHLIQEDDKERAAFIICGRSLVNGIEERLLTREVHLLSEKDLLSYERYQVSWNNNHFIKILEKAESKYFAVVVILNTIFFNWHLIVMVVAILTAALL
jgi:5-formaminoimidazole-4-carboxamide-1-beta-D-ribofuranosyl 5'-monophosphate synthetase